LPISLYFGFCTGVFSHNHNHCPTFKSKRLNSIFAAWLSVFYGYPTFAWIPTHNLNHHKFVNRNGDATVTWRHTNENTWLVASTYFFVSAYHQSVPIREYIGKARKNPRLFRQILIQYATTAVGHAALLALAIAMHGLRRGALVYVFAMGIPSFFALWSMMFINYIQHVHTDPWSAHDHSRNFVGKLGNFLVFNNGFHTVHHENAGLHWSKLAERHAEIEHAIHPALKQQSIWGFCLRSYLLGAFSPRFRTTQVGRAASDPPDGDSMRAPARATRPPWCPRIDAPLPDRHRALRPRRRSRVPPSSCAAPGARPGDAPPVRGAPAARRVVGANRSGG
jgi:fatty acid desaturase